MEASSQPSQKVTDALAEAILNEDFREKLFTDPDTAVSGLNDQDRKILKSIPRDAFDSCVQSFLTRAPSGTEPVAITLIWHRDKPAAAP